MSKAADAGKSFLAGVLAKLPEEYRGQVETAFNDARAADALTVIGAGALAQSDINRKYAELQTKNEELDGYKSTLDSWWETRQTDIAELEEYRAGKKTPAGTPPSPTSTPTPADLAGVIRKDEFEKIMQREQMAAAGYLAIQQTLAMQHYDRFKEVIDPAELLRDPHLGKQKPDGGIYGLKDAYTTKYADKLTAFEAEQERIRIAKLVEEGVAEKLKGQPVHQAFPLRSQPSALDLLEAGAEYKPEQYTAAAAAEEYARLQQQRTQ